MSMRGNALFSIRDDPTPKVMNGKTAYTIGARDYKGALCVMVKVLENHPADSRVKLSENGIVQTLSGRMGTGGGNTPLIVEDYADARTQDQIQEVWQSSSCEWKGGDGMNDVSNMVVRRLTPL